MSWYDCRGLAVRSRQSQAIVFAPGMSDEKLGAMTADRWKELVQQLNDLKIVTSKVNLEDVIRYRFSCRDSHLPSDELRPSIEEDSISIQD